nr:hypothetical protein HK105_008188 [Polyrhizophydium stewartii]
MADPYTSAGAANGGNGGFRTGGDPFFEHRTLLEDDDWADSDPALDRARIDSVPALDFYGILNVERKASEDEIKNSYKRLCVTFHPDKYIDDDEKLAAQKKFQLVQRAYDVLSDPNRRHIYDLYGETAVDQAWDLGPRLKSQEEIREEYERRARIKREMDAQNLVKSRGEISLELDATRFFVKRPKAARFRGARLGLPVADSFSIADLLPDLRRAIVTHSWEVTAVVSQKPSAQFKLVRNFSSDRVTANSTGYLTYSPGLFRIGSWGPDDPRDIGNSSCALGIVHSVQKRQWSCDIEAGILESHITVAHTRVVPGHIRARFEVTTSTSGGIRISVSGDRRVDRNTRVGMGVTCGAIGGVTLRFRSIEQVRRENADILLERMHDALQAIELMRESVARRVEIEESRNGLVVIQALYGKLPPSELTAVRALSPQGIKDMAAAIRKQIKSVLTPGSRTTLDQAAASVDYIDVTIAIQSFVQSGQLHISGSHSKSNLIGFWDPCLGERKRLRITYQFQGRIHQVEVDDKAPVAAPLRAHLSRGYAMHSLHSVLQHGQLGFKQERIDLSNIPHSIKNMIVEQSSAKLRDYEPLKVCVRSDLKYSTLDTRQHLAEKKKRIEDVYKCGFCADPKELYRPLGDPTLDTEILLYQRLGIDPSAQDKKSQQKRDVFKEETLQKTSIKNQRKFRDVPKRHTNGFKYIKEKVAKSNLKVNSVKARLRTNRNVRPGLSVLLTGRFGTQFGVPFSSVCEVDDREHTYDKKDEPVDPESMTKGEIAPPAYKTSQIKLSAKQIEGVLGIRASEQTTETTEKFFTTRDDFYEQRQRLTHLLHDDLNSHPNAPSIMQKGQCVDDITAMRQKAADLRRKEKKAILDAHPWYNELIRKVVVMNGVRREVTQYESLLLGRLKRLIEDQIIFNKKVFVQLMRVLPTREFLKDEVQRIIRFVKQHESISERDYLEAVEMAGHPIH